MQSVILKIDLERGLQHLSVKERLVIHGLFTLSHTEDSLSQRLMVSRRRVRNLKKEGLEKLKRYFVPRNEINQLFVG